jgi:hypothetical protein
MANSPVLHQPVGTLLATARLTHALTVKTAVRLAALVAATTEPLLLAMLP